MVAHYAQPCWCHCWRTGRWGGTCCVASVGVATTDVVAAASGADAASEYLASVDAVAAYDVIVASGSLNDVSSGNRLLQVGACCYV